MLELRAGPQTEHAQWQHAKKYQGPGEGFREAMNRVANALKDDEAHYHEFRDILLHQRFLPAGRVQAAMGSTKNVTAFNCFVSGTIEDSFVDGQGSIMQRAVQAATTMRMGGGIGYDFSTLRPRGDLIRKLQSRSTGPVSFMGIYNEIGLSTSSTDHRRGAQMGVMRIDHPDIEEFLRAKQNSNKLTGFNISIGVTDEFMECLETGRPFWLRWGGRDYREVDPAALWDMVMRATWDWAEPGVLFIDTINKNNNLFYCETIAATNPCGEQPLPPFGACLLGSFNLVKYLSQDRALLSNPPQARYSFDFDQLREDIPLVVRAMDNVVDRTTYPLYEQEQEARQKRRMGLGVTGVANALEACGHPYGTPGFLALLADVLGVIRDECYRASALLAKEKGSFPLYDDRYLDATMIRHLPDEVRDLIRLYGTRNSHLTSIAPTGTISLTADNVSSGIEPVFSYTQRRTIQQFEGPKEVALNDFGYSFLGVHGRTTAELGVDEHLAVLTTCVPYVDSAVSKTLTVQSSVGWNDFKGIYSRAWEGGVKGCTTFRPDGKRFGVIHDAGDTVEPGANSTCVINEDGTRDCGE